MELVKIATGEPITREQIIADASVDGIDLSLPADLTGVDLSEFGAVLVQPADAPAVSAGEVAELDGVEFSGDAWRQKWVIRNRTSDEFAAYERDLHLQIDAAAGAFRTRFITDVPGQQQTYAEKEAEARAWTSEADPADFPFLTAEAAARGVPIADVVALVIGTANAWRVLGAAIEGTRMGAKAGVTAARQANDWAAMEMAATVDWEALA